MMVIFIESIGILAGILGVIAWIPQIHKIWFKDLHEGVSIPTLLIILSTLILWITYGFLINSFALVISNLFALTSVSIVLIGVLKLQKNDLIS